MRTWCVSLSFFPMSVCFRIRGSTRAKWKRRQSNRHKYYSLYLCMLPPMLIHLRMCIWALHTIRIILFSLFNVACLLGFPLLFLLLPFFLDVDEIYTFLIFLLWPPDVNKRAWCLYSDNTSVNLICSSSVCIH